MTKKRGRPKGSLGKKKREAMAAAQLSTQTSVPTQRSTRANTHDSEEAIFDDEAPFLEDDEEEEDFSQKIENAIDKAISVLSADLRSLKKELKEELKSHVRRITKLEKANEELKNRCQSLHEKVAKLEKENSEQYTLLNKQERFSRRNNLRLVGVKFTEQEDCIQLAKATFAEIGLQDCKIERAHRDGKLVPGRDRHILVKVSFYQDKLFLLRNARSKLQNKPYFITDDLTIQDLKEKRRWTTQVTALYQAGTRLRFSGGAWRGADGRRYKFAE
ncbi:LINE-1 retrotransposable element ORF1 protein [Holothuria leucospilota]|uniref:LINE-1 retrotransposable element ORF1 protein n=1 Tax=Holothuria leucospilota TaxID=206669 RepID=A0A9Q0YRL7_HOLLE|nr:LINE-1 retrotransposable element ORF1 protein [Holothuria leucospilota]